MAQGIDFTAMIRGEQLAENANWANIRRIQDQDTYAIQREEALAKQLQQRQGREASHYLSTILPNLQRYADQGLNPADALINQRAAIQNDASFQSMSPEVQTQILNGLGQTAALHMQGLAKSGDYTTLQKLVGAFGVSNPINPLGAAVASGDPMAVLKELNVRTNDAYAMSPDGKSAIYKATGQAIPLETLVANVAAGLGNENSAAGVYGALHQQSQQDRTLSAAEAQQKQSDTYQAAIALQSGMNPDTVRMIFKAADPAVFTAAATAAIPGAAAGPTVATPEQVAALQTPIVPGVATPGATPGAATPGAAMSAVQQLAAQVQNATVPQLDRSLSTLVQQIEQGKTRQVQLAETQKVLQQQLAFYAAEANKASPFTLESEQGPAKRMVDAIQQKLAEIDKEFGLIAKNMQGFTQLARQIQTKRQMLGLPSVSNAATPTTDVWAQLQGDLTK